MDMQNDFVSGALGSAEAVKILPAVRDRIRAAREAGETVVFTRDTHEENYLLTQEGKNLPVPHCLKGSVGWELVEGLRAEGEIVFDKPSFGSVALAEFIRDGSFGEAEFIGVCTDICVVSNVLLTKAFCPETKITVSPDCCAGAAPETHEAALAVMRSCQVGMNRTEERKSF